MKMLSRQASLARFHCYTNVGHKAGCYMWLYHKGKLLVREDKYRTSTHDNTFNDSCDFNITGRYDPETKVLSFAVFSPLSQSKLDKVLDALYNEFPEAETLAMFTDNS